MWNSGKTSYAVFIKVLATGAIYELPFTSFTFTEELNQGKSGTVTVDYLTFKNAVSAYNVDFMTLMIGATNEIWIEKSVIGSYTSTKLFDGVVSDFQIAKNTQGVMTVTIAMIGWLTMLNYRRTGVGVTFTAQDAAQIAWSLINTTQTNGSYGNLGIVQGLAPTTVNRSITYNNAHIFDEIINLSNAKLASGFDFDLDNSKNFNIYYPFKGVSLPNVIFDDQNVNQWVFHDPLASSLVNTIWYSGDGSGANANIQYVQAAATFLSAYGLLENDISDKTLTDPSAILAAANLYLTYHQTPLADFTITHLDDAPDITAYNLGDFPFFTIPDLEISNRQLRVWKRQFSLDNSITPTIVLTVH